MKMLYVHGLSSSGTADRLRRYLPDDVIFSPDLPVEPDEALVLLQDLVKREGIDLFKKFRLQLKHGEIYFPPQGI